MQTLTTMLPRPSWRVVSLVAALLLLLTTCGSGYDRTSRIDVRPMASGSTPAATPLAVDRPLSEVAGGAGDTDMVETTALDEGPTDTPAPPAEEPTEQESAAPEQAPEPEPLPEEVELHEPDVMLRSEDAVPTTHADVEGANHGTGVGELTAATEDTDGERHELELMAVDAEGFRPFTPEVTAQSPAVWERLDDGDVLVRHDVAYELGLELGENMLLESENGSLEVRVGALAANGAPPFADVIVPFEVAAQLGSPGVNALILSADDAPEHLADALEGLGDVELRRPPEPEQATTQPTSGPVELESFTYTSRGDGTIAIHGDWVQRNIVNVDIPRMGTTRCHRAMVPQLYAALQEIIDEGLYDHFKPEQFGGCWVPRHILWNPDRNLSMHAWGLAIDFNVQDNWFGEEPQMDPRIVQIFEKWGFEWGGHWSTPDGMHFELDRFVEVP